MVRKSFLVGLTLLVVLFGLAAFYREDAALGQLPHSWEVDDGVHTNMKGANPEPDNDQVSDLPSLVEAALISDQCNNSTFLEEFFPDKQWETYQLTDYFKGKPLGEPWEEYPGSLIDDHHSTGRDMNTIDPLYDLVSKRKDMWDEEALPGQRTIVVHLRLGDVIDASIDSVRDILLEQKYFYRQNQNKECCADPWKWPGNPPLIEDWNAYVRPLSYYSNILEGVEDHRSVVVMGSAHMGQLPEDVRRRGVSKSCQYAMAIRAYLSLRFPSAAMSLRFGHPPDDDLVFASQSTTYLQSGGGFSDLIGQLVIKFGGNILK